jgi:hypothetical protein
MLRVVFGFKMHVDFYSSPEKGKIIYLCMCSGVRTLRILKYNLQKFETDFKQNDPYLEKEQQLFPMFF